MSKTYLPYEPDQQLLLPAALQEWLPDEHLAYFISDVVDQLDMSEVTARYERERRGGPPYHPRMMVKVLLYGYCVGVASSRRIAQRLHEDIAFRVLAANNTPDFRTISDFRKDNLDALSGLFVQVLALCQQAGLVKLGHVALDGTKVKANASKHKAMSYQRMKEKAAQLAAEVAELLRQAQAADDEEDRRYGKDKRGDELPQELAFREGRLEKIREAMVALEAEAQAAAERAEAEGGKHPGVPDGKAQRNFTDTESRIMPAPGGKDFLQAYNCQAVVDSAHQVIVAARATNQTSDKQQAAAMMEETIDNVGAVPREVSADAGYYSAKAVDELCALGVDPFVAPEQTRHGRVVPPAPRGRIPSNLSPRDRMRRKLQTKRGRQRYALRMQTVEPVFGQIKQGRGCRQFLLRGLEKVNGEWSLICTGHNLLKLFRFGVNLHRKARVDGPAQRIRNFAEVVEHGAIRKAIWGPAGATGTISCRDPLSLTRKHRQIILGRAARVCELVNRGRAQDCSAPAASVHGRQLGPPVVGVVVTCRLGYHPVEAFAGDDPRVNRLEIPAVDRSDQQAEHHQPDYESEDHSYRPSDKICSHHFLVLLLCLFVSSLPNVPKRSLARGGKKISSLMPALPAYPHQGKWTGHRQND